MESPVGSVATALKVGLVLCVRPSAGETCEIMGSSSGVVNVMFSFILFPQVSSAVTVSVWLPVVMSAEANA